MKKKVAIDTNFFLLPYQNKIDIFKLLDIVIEKPHDYVISSTIVDELKKISKNKGKTGAAAKLGLKLIELHNIEVIPTKITPDRWLEKYAEENKAIICTNDKKLKNKLKQKGILVITTKGKDWLGFV